MFKLYTKISFAHFKICTLLFSRKVADEIPHGSKDGSK